jgi:hypothetical protein
VLGVVQADHVETGDDSVESLQGHASVAIPRQWGLDVVRNSQARIVQCRLTRAARACARGAPSTEVPRLPEPDCQKHESDAHNSLHQLVRLDSPLG